MYKKSKNQNASGASRFPTCSLGHSDFFSQNHHNYHARGYDADRLVSRVDELLASVRPDLIWHPETSEICIKAPSLREARAVNPRSELEDLMESLWERAADEWYKENVDDQYKRLMDSMEQAMDAMDFGTMERIRDQMDEYWNQKNEH